MTSTTNQNQNPNQNASIRNDIKNQLNNPQPTFYMNATTATTTTIHSSTSAAVHESHQLHNTASIEREECNKVKAACSSSPSAASSQTHLQYIYSRPSSSPSMSHHSKIAITTNPHKDTSYSPRQIRNERHTNATECSSSSSSCCSSISSNSSAAIAASGNLTIGVVQSNASDNLGTPVAMTQKTRSSVPSDKINLRLILVSGKTKEFLFNPTDSAGDIAQIVFDSWPEDWKSEAVSKADILRLIYQGRFLHCNVTLGALGLPLGKTTVMHLVPRDNLPEPNSQDQRQKSKGGSSRCCSTACCIL